jgi:DNA-binding response OmpR family regulator
MPNSQTNKISPKRILLVDDDLTVTRSMQLMLAQDKHQVEVAGDSDAALRLYDSDRFDLVILDFQMPGADGLELARLIRTWNSAQPILLITANMADMERSGGKREYFTSVLEKPFSADGLRAAIAASLPPA